MIVLVQVVNYTLSMLMWLILGRAALGLLTGGRQSLVQAAFDRPTLPLFALTRRALPFVGETAAPLVTLLLLGVLRLSLILLAHPAAGR